MAEQPYIGEIRLFTCVDAPAGWLLCDSSVYQVTDYQQLFANIGNTYGGNSQQGTFQVPDLRAHVPSVGGSLMNHQNAGNAQTACAPCLALNFCIAYEGADQL